MEDKKIEVTRGDKKIICKLHTEHGEYEGISINIIDLTKPILDTRYLSLNPALYVDTISTNFNPYVTTRLIEKGWNLRVPAECYTIEDDIGEDNIKYIFEGKYLGNIVFNTMDGKRVVCFISQKESKRYYKFLDLTDTNVLACTEWDMDWEYLGICDEENEIAHAEYLRRLRQMKLQFSFTTQIDTNSDEKLIDCNGEGITEEGSKKYEKFKRNIMDLLNIGYALEQKDSNPNIE